MNIKLQLHFGFVRGFDIFFVTSQLCYLFARCNYVFRITLYFGAFELRMEITIQLRFDFALRYFLSYHNYVIYLFDVVTFLMSSELCYILVRSNYVRKLRYKMVIF